MPLMSFEQYNKINHKIPYPLKLKLGKYYLFYFGESHRYDPKDKQWVLVRKFWKEFLQATRGKKRIVFLEGGHTDPDKTAEEGIRKGSGMGLVAFLAAEEGLKVFSPEPSEKYERQQLEKKYSRKVIQYYYFARVVHQWGRLVNPKPDFEHYIARYLIGDKKQSGWKKFDFSLSGMKKIHVELFKKAFNHKDTGFFAKLSNPTILATPVNHVARASNLVRDENIVNEIKKYNKRGYSIFAQYGYTHVAMQEPLLKEIWNISRS